MSDDEHLRRARPHRAGHQPQQPGHHRHPQILMKTTKFWFTFKSPPKFNPLGIGCGVTAYSYEDALQILKEKLFPSTGTLEVSEALSDFDMRLLDGGHVLPNMENAFQRGIWFPKGYR